ncbi:GAF and ANTAR domain-containing protein [Pseudonocardia lacus]|uniref:GAF and ANTAR domain-containing protein n=1 Tax=Pseudonocardia lacus TaxID=2835865 RepID=UPI001BDD8002|nr:GAF and ANTAR domain-containing protein [Pseudonocardia lacus]
MNDQESLAEAFAQLADVDDVSFVTGEFFQRLCGHYVRLGGVDGAGLLLADTTGRLEAPAAAGDRVRELGELQLSAEEGPGVDCHRSGQVVEVDDVADVGDVVGVRGRWPRFAPACRLAGFGAVHAIPMHRRDRVIGAVTLFTTAAGRLDPSTARILRSLTDLATIVLLHQRALHHQFLVIEQLQTALTSRAVIEQAKGILAERTGLDPGGAFDVMRGLARARNLGLTALARDIVAGNAGPPWRGPQPGGTPPVS